MKSKYRKILLAVTIMLAVHILSAQNIIVPLTIDNGSSNIYFPTAIYERSNPNYDATETYKGIPKNIDDYLIKIFDFQPEQAWYEMYKRLKGTMNKNDLVYILKQYNLKLEDTVRLSSYPIKHFISFLIYKSGDKTIVLPDTNNNHDFSDEFPILSEMKDSVQKKIDNNIKFSYQYVKNGVVLDKYFQLKINTFPHIFKYSDTLEQKLYLTISSQEYRKGELSIKGEKKTIKVFSMNPNLIQYDTKSKIFSQDKSINLDRYYVVNDTLSIGDLSYLIRKLSFWGDSLCLDYVGKHSKEYGCYPNKYAYNIESIDLMTGRKVSLNKLENKTVLLDFWGTWCKPCMGKIPELKKISEKFKSKIKIISVAVDSTSRIPLLKEIIRQNDMDWFHLFDNMDTIDSNSISSLFKVYTFPTQILISPKGKIIFRSFDAQYLDEKKMRVLLEN